MKENDSYSSYSGGSLNNPNNLTHHFSAKSFKDWLLDITNPIVYCLLTMDGKDFLIKNSFETKLHQKTNKLDSFSITVPNDAIDAFEDYVLEKSKYLIGKKITIKYYQYGKIQQSFSGIIDQVKDKRNGTGYGDLILKGKSPALLLHNGKKHRTFSNASLQQIISKVCTTYPSEAKIEVSDWHNTKDKIFPYIVQSKESDFEFLQRLAKKYGEYFYYNGEQIIFGNAVQPIIEIGEGRDLDCLDLKIKLKPQNFTYQSYNDAIAGKSEQSGGTNGANFIQQKENMMQVTALNQSKKVFAETPKMYYNLANIGSGEDAELRDAVQREKEKRQNVMSVKGRSRNPALRIGSRAKISDINSRAMETYRVLEIKHFHDGNEYYNEFTAIPDLFQAPYQDNNVFPVGEKQSAKVIDNNDPESRGRVQVQFPWQEAENEKTPWLRIATLHAGSGKGTNFIPEIGEEVLIAYESNNAERPYVAGVLYNGKEKSGYHTQGNDLKVIKTRSGIENISNDAEGSWKQSTPDGNFLHFDGQGNAMLNVPKNLTINAGGNFNIQVGHNLTFNVVDVALFNIFKQTIFTTPILHQISEYYKLQSTSALINSEKDFKIESKDTQLAGFENLLVHSNQSAIINSKGDIEVRGESGTKLSNTASELSMTQVTITATLFASFRPMNNWNGQNYGFDWYRVADTKKVYGSKWAGDKFYDTLVGQYDKYPSNNPDAKFSVNTTMINSLKNEYGIASLIPWYKVKGKPVETLPSWLLLKKNVDVRVSLDVFIQDKKNLPQNVFVAYEHEYFTIQTSAGAGSANSTAESSPKDNMHYARLAVRAEKRFSIVDGITIKCIKDIPVGTSKTIRVISDQQEAGFLHVYSNSSKKIDVVLVKVWGDFGNGVKIGSSNGRIELTNALKQANINPTFQEVDLDIRHLRGTTNPNTLIQSNTLMNINEINVSGNINGLTLSEYLDDEFRNRPIGKNTDGSFKYENYLRVYFVNEKAFITADRLSVGGIGSPIGGGRCIMYVGGTARDVAHECCHSLGLGHTFGTASNSSARFLYKFKATENIMDYGHLAKITPYSLWKWQWGILRSHSLVQDIVVTPPANPTSTPTPSGTPTSTPVSTAGGR